MAALQPPAAARIERFDSFDSNYSTSELSEATAASEQQADNALKPALEELPVIASLTVHGHGKGTNKKHMSRGDLVGVALRAVSRHILRGPELETWNIAETATVAVLREVLGGKNSTGPPTLDDIKLTRKAMDAGVPKVPKELRITPLTAPRRHAEMLPEGDKGVLAGEVSVELVEYVGPEKPASDKVVLLLHGGAYFLGSPRSHRWASQGVALGLRSKVVAVDYALAPEHKYPRGLLDCISAYLALVDPRGSSPLPKLRPEQVVLMGDSAGGGMSTACLLYLRDKGLPMPGGAVLISPWTDLTLSDPYNQLCFHDYLPSDPDAVMGARSRVRLQDDPNGSYIYCTKREALEDPYASPLFHPSLSSLPPILIQAGGAERVLGQSTLLAFKLASEPAQDVSLEVYDDQIHVFQLMARAHPASKKAMARLVEWIRTLPSARAEKPRKAFFRVGKRELEPRAGETAAAAADPKALAREMLDRCAQVRGLEGKLLKAKRKPWGEERVRSKGPIEVGERLEVYEEWAKKML
ncbi:Alpha/Beta hydrolase protein [Hyaloraphidium curvatum]|nr:Alpha/Beta hydrolase protein [Hyaloraphidium curvatum]